MTYLSLKYKRETRTALSKDSMTQDKRRKHRPQLVGQNHGYTIVDHELTWVAHKAFPLVHLHDFIKTWLKLVHRVNARFAKASFAVTMLLLAALPLG